MSPSSDTKFRCSRLGNGDLRLSNDSFTSSETHDHSLATSDISAEQFEKFRTDLETQCRPGAGQKQIRCGVDVLPPGEKHSQQHNLQFELAALNHEMAQIQIECEEIVKAQHARGYIAESHSEAVRTEPVFRSPRMVPRMGTRLDYIRQVPSLLDQPAGGRGRLAAPLSQSDTLSGSTVRDDKDTSTSAYNTGDSCRSTPLTLELHDTTDSTGGRLSSMLSLPNKAQSNSDPETVQRGLTGELCGAGLTKAGSTNSVSRQCQTAQETNDDDSLQELYAQYADVMYTNKANLQHTIMVQQRLFEQQLAQRAGPSVASNSRLPDVCSSIPPTPTSPVQSPELDSVPVLSGDSANVKMKWVVKRRGDGSRYITRRPVRSELLKARARKLAEERCGMTTDDDVVSEMKVGRYWSKDERRHHMEKVREHKHRKEQILRQKMETLKEAEESMKEPTIVQLSHRKMMRHKAKRTLDNFVTVQEMLAHGNRDMQGKTYNPLLSVTTV